MDLFVSIREPCSGEPGGLRLRALTALDFPHCSVPGFQCNASLGMESGQIANDQISASSTYLDGRWTPQQGRLRGDDNGWTPNLDSSKEYLQVITQMLLDVACGGLGQEQKWFLLA